MAEKSDKKEAKAPAEGAAKAPQAAKAKKSGRGRKEDVKRAGFEANIEEGLEAKPARLKLRFRKEIVPALMKEFSFKNPNQVPRLEKIVVNMGLGEALANNKILESGVDQLAALTGQKPVVTRARKSIANFKLREGNPIGTKVTLRGARMWEFLDRLISLAIPRVRDFRGLNPRAFDGRGNYTFGVTEQLIFPEIDYDKIDTTRGMDITIVTTARTDAEGKALLAAFGFPFRREGQQ